MKGLGLHRFRMSATGTGGTTNAYEAVSVVRAAKRLRVEAPTVVRQGRRMSLRVPGLGRREVYRITLTRPGSRTPLVRTITGRANKAGVIRRRVLVPRLTTRDRRIVVTVTGGPRRAGSTTIRVR